MLVRKITSYDDVAPIFDAQTTLTADQKRVKETLRRFYSSVPRGTDCWFLPFQQVATTKTFAKVFDNGNANSEARKLVDESNKGFRQMGVIVQELTGSNPTAAAASGLDQGILGKAGSAVATIQAFIDAAAPNSPFSSSPWHRDHKYRVNDFYSC